MKTWQRAGLGLSALVLGALAFFMFAIPVSLQEPEDVTYTAEMTEQLAGGRYEKNEDLELVSIDTSRVDGRFTLRGTIRSTSGHHYDYIEVNMGTFDRSGTMLGSVTEVVLSDPNATEWAIEVSATDPNTTRMDLLRSVAR